MARLGIDRQALSPPPIMFCYWADAKANQAFARMQNVSEDVLRIIGANRAWLKSYGVVVSLTRNPKTPLSMSMSMMARLQTKDLQRLAVDRNVSEALRIAARKKVVASASGKDKA